MHLLHSLAVVLQAVAAVESAKWTLDRSCYEDEGLRNAMIDSVKTAKSRALEGALRLSNSKSVLFGRTLRKAVQVLIGFDDYNKKVDNIIKRFNKFDKLKGPIGKSEGTYADSSEWAALADNEDHYLDFIIYCAPSLSTYQDLYGNVYPYDNARHQYLTHTNILDQMKREHDSKVWENPTKNTVAITYVDDDVDKKGVPKGDRKKVPETITFHPLYLEIIKDRNYDMFTGKRLRAAAKGGARDKLEEANTVPVDALMGLEGTMLHEFFHLSAFGKMKDTPKDSAYGWVNNVKYQIINNPDLLAYVALLADLVEKKKYKVTPDGQLSSV